jgi:hypothetical protein
MWFFIGIEAGAVLGFALVLAFAQTLLGVDVPFADIRQLLADPGNPTTATLFAALGKELTEGAAPSPVELSQTLHNYIGYAAIAGAVVLGFSGRMLDRAFKTEW